MGYAAEGSENNDVTGGDDFRTGVDIAIYDDSAIVKDALAATDGMGDVKRIPLAELWSLFGLWSLTNRRHHHRWKHIVDC
jgi:hypothetical protein